MGLLGEFINGAIRGAADTLGWSGDKERDALRRQELYGNRNNDHKKKADEKQTAVD